ncbi:MAG TPA: glycosyltransferase family 39 protein [Bryobacteraceae bacterium]|nr:glycosyltransferase family 39 protein [Bryobacteraceae bacterium]
MRKPGQPGVSLSFFAILFAITLALRLCHARILWTDEDYHLAAGIQTLHGKLLYRDLWYDKPPLAAWVYAAFGAFPGWPLRLFDAFYILAVCAAMYRFARDVWSEREGLAAAALLGFFLSFDHASAIIPVAPDLFLMLPQILAVHCAWRKQAFQAGLWSGIAFLFHVKGLLVLAMCALLAGPSILPLLAGFLIPAGAVLGGLAAAGALRGYGQQVWQWGLAYSRISPLENPWGNAARRTADWLGFHAALVLGAVWLWWKEPARGRRWIAVWCLLSFAGVTLGTQFAPRYFLQLLPPLTLAASRGVSLLFEDVRGRRNRLAWAAMVVAALIPFIRFGPRYVLLARDLLTGRAHRWSDVVLNQDDQRVAARINQMKSTGDTLFVWGYRPGVFVYTRLTAASIFWDSQPLTGVPADRHLFDSRPILPELAARNRALLVTSHPTFVVDGLSALNTALSMRNYPELRGWLRDYSIVARTDLSVVYRLNEVIQACTEPSGPADDVGERW